MRRPPLATALTLIPLLAPALAAEDWPSFRGASARGVADGQDLPLEWDPDGGANVRWRREIPGVGHASPIVAGGRVFVVTAVTAGETELVLGDEGGIDLAADAGREFSWRLYCLDAATGEVLWEREAYAGEPRATRHVKSSQANATPSSDGETVVALFGSQGLVAYDAQGEELWRRDLGVLDPGLYGDATSQWGHASSPVVWRDRVFVQVDRHADSFVAAYDLSTGEELWRVERDEKPVWATPTIDESRDRAQLLVIGGDWDRGLDPRTGRELWRFARDLEVKTTSPFVADGLVILSGGYRNRELFAVSAAAEGMVEGDELVWTSEPGGPYTSTPVAYRGRLYFVTNTGIFNVLDLATGERLHRQRLEDTYSASPVATDGRIVLAGEGGVVRVLSSEPPFAELAAVDMGEPCLATPAVADGTLYLRCRSHLWAVSGRTE